jgi:hypothetical protein
MIEMVEVAVAQLEFDTKNPRLGKEQTSQLETAHALAAQQGPRLVNLAKHIVDNGIDPTTLTAVVALPGRRPRYKVLEGNRRLLALRALESPSIVTPALEPREVRAINKLAIDFTANPIDRINCIRFDNEDEARPWVELRHTGGNSAGLVQWTAEEKRRYEARFGPGSVELQVLDFVKATGGIDADATGTFITNINRALMSAKLQANFGLVKDADGRVLSWFPLEEITKPLTRIVSDMHSGAMNSRDLNGPADRENYYKGFAKKDLPNQKKRLSTPVSLDDLATGFTSAAAGGSAARKRPRPRARLRTTLIPKDCSLNPTSTRLDDIVRELKSMNLNDYPNACSVLLRVFTELAMDDTIDQMNLQAVVTEKDALAKKIREVARHLRKKDQISDQLKKAMESVASNNTHALAAGVVTWHQYVHNKFTHPKATELRQSWDELQPFLQALWP